ncbi:MAG: hypothetical protein ACLUO6_09895 [Ruminococcus sp.]
MIYQENIVENSNLKFRGEIPLPYRINAGKEKSHSGLSNRRQYES